MQNKLVITKDKNRIITSLFEDDHLVEINAEEEQSRQIIGNIYIGKVKNILRNIQGAFIDIGIDDMCYYSLEDNKNPLFINSKNNNKVNVGDEIIVQVVKEAIKSKGPLVTSNLSFTGKYAVLTTGKNYVGISNKIEDDIIRRHLKELIQPYTSDEYGFIIRTNAQFSDNEQIIKEVEHLVNRYNNIKQVGQYRTCYQIVEKAPSSFICEIRDTYINKLDSIYVEDQQLYNEILEYLSVYQSEDVSKLHLYYDKNLPLANLYGINSKIENAMKSKIWLKSGASIVIQPTEAFVAIDVNTGKFTGKKNIDDTFLKINIEAAKEICKQLRIRNLSGIIVVDFIDMHIEGYKEVLLNTIEEELKKDPVKATLVGISKLNLVEITRKKVRKPIYELFGRVCSCCRGRGYVEIE